MNFVNCSTATIYDTTRHPMVKSRQGFRMAYEDDPTFVEFRRVVSEMTARNDVKPISNSTFYTLWYESANFRNHWQASKYTNDIAKKLIFICGLNMINYERSLMILVTWAKKFFSGEVVNDWCGKVFDKEWERITPSIELKRIERNKKRKEKRMSKNMNNTKKRGRPAETDGLKAKILKLLEREGRMTINLLAKELEGVATSSAIEAQLHRMKGKEVVTPVRGLYELAA
jgi:hypothetical protein